MAERRYCKNTVPGRQGRGKKYPAKVRAEVVMAMIGTNSICAVARKYGVPESTIRSWVAEEAKKPDGEFAKARAEADAGSHNPYSLRRPQNVRSVFAGCLVVG